MPETIRANEAFNITVRLSAVLKPEILKAYDLKKPELVLMDWLPGTPQMLGIDFTIHSDVAAMGKEIDEIVFEVPPLSEGDFILRMSTAVSREWGGLDLSYNMGSLRLLHPENDARRGGIEIPFTVLPADDDGVGTYDAFIEAVNELGAEYKARIYREFLGIEPPEGSLDPRL